MSFVKTSQTEEALHTMSNFFVDAAAEGVLDEDAVADYEVYRASVKEGREKSLHLLPLLLDCCVNNDREEFYAVLQTVRKQIYKEKRQQQPAATPGA